MTLPVLSGKLDKQGYLGELRNRTPQELTELLRRQQNLKANVKFIQRLPDKGEKIDRMIERLEELLAQHKDVDNTARMFEKMALDAETAQQQRIPQSAADDEEDDDDEASDRLKHLINRSTQEKAVKFENSYERVIRKAEEKSQKNKFFPHRTVHTKDVDQLEQKLDIVSLKMQQGDKVDFDPTYGKPASPKPDTSETDSPNAAQDMEVKSSEETTPSSAKGASPHHHHKTQDPATGHKTLQDLGKPEGVKFKHRYDESLMPTPSIIKCSAAKLIDVTESAQLQTDQKHKQDELQAKNAAKRLAERLHYRMGSFQPQGSARVAFREPQPEEDEGVDSDDAELDYPD